MYTPFDKDLGALSAADLLVLRTIAEGWFVEYKRECPAARDIAKSLCAFANHMGGWFSSASMPTRKV
jgi:hypothetical protein